MSEALQKFRAEVASDAALRQAVLQALDKGLPGVLEVAAQRGYVIQPQEAQDAFANGELSDDELEMVSGGGAVKFYANPTEASEDRDR